MVSKFTLGAIKDILDERDFSIKDYLPIKEIPPKLDLSGRMLPVRNQGQEGTCVAFAATAVKESQENKEGYLSPRFIYDKIELPAGGAYPRDSMKVLLTEGVCPEKCQPYIPNTKTSPCKEAKNLALPNKIKRYARLKTIDEFKACLNTHGPFLIAFGVTEAWYTPVNGVIINEGNDPKILGGHAVTCVGYDDEKRLLKFKNSWGSSWGTDGYGFISYTDAINTLYDAWSSVDVPEEEEVHTTSKNELWLAKIVAMIAAFIKQLRFNS